MTKRSLKIRATEHRFPSRAKHTYHHINRCPTYISKLQEFERNDIPPNSEITFIKKMRQIFYGQFHKTAEKLSKFLRTTKCSSFLHKNP
jgi:hypothetical protein